MSLDCYFDYFIGFYDEALSELVMKLMSSFYHISRLGKEFLEDASLLTVL